MCELGYECKWMDYSKTTTELYIYFVLLKAKNKGISCVKQSQSLAEFSKQHKASEICQAWIVDLITKLQNYIIWNGGSLRKQNKKERQVWKPECGQDTFPENIAFVQL